MELDRKLSKELFPALSLGIFMLIAGFSKFFILDYWTGYEPQLVIQLVPLTADQLVLAGGLFEALLGAVLVSGKRTKTVSLLTAFYLSLITLQMINLGFWDLAIRDSGLVMYALTVYTVETR